MRQMCLLLGGEKGRTIVWFCTDAPSLIHTVHCCASPNNIDNTMHSPCSSASRSNQPFCDRPCLSSCHPYRSSALGRGPKCPMHMYKDGQQRDSEVTVLAYLVAVVTCGGGGARRGGGGGLCVVQKGGLSDQWPVASDPVAWQKQTRRSTVGGRTGAIALSMHRVHALHTLRLTSTSSTVVHTIGHDIPGRRRQPLDLFGRRSTSHKTLKGIQDGPGGDQQTAGKGQAQAIRRLACRTPTGSIFLTVCSDSLLIVAVHTSRIFIFRTFDPSSVYSTVNHCGDVLTPSWCSVCPTASDSHNGAREDARGNVYRRIRASQ